MEEREKCLDKAKESVTGHRVQDYGKPENNFAVIADYWTTYLKGKSDGLLVDFRFTPRDVANMMILFKHGRITTGTATADSYVDIAGYSACAYELGYDEPPKVQSGDQTEKGVVNKVAITYTDEGGL